MQDRFLKVRLILNFLIKKLKEKTIIFTTKDPKSGFSVFFRIVGNAKGRRIEVEEVEMYFSWRSIG